MEPEYVISPDGEWIETISKIDSEQPFLRNEEDYEWYNSFLSEQGYDEDDYLNY